MIGRDILQAAKLLQAGEVVGIPTETVYGLAANALNEKAILKVFQIKNRPFFDPLISHIASPADLGKYVTHIPDDALQLAEKFWPGPLTLLLPKKALISDLISSGSPFMAIRVPGHPMTLELLKHLDFPLAAPSANPFGYISPTQAQHVENQLGDKVTYILDGGASAVGLESTIVDCNEAKPKILRLGGLSIQAIEEVLGKPAVLSLTQNSNPHAPGQLDKHYAPHTPFILTEDIEMELAKNKDKRLAVLNFGKPSIPEHIYSLNLSPSENLEEASSRLFHYMRLLDDLKFDLILAVQLPQTGLGRAINDRLNRASIK